MNNNHYIKDYVKKKKCTLLGVGPMSKNVVDESIRLSDKHKIPLILIASRRQIDSSKFNGGYVANWTTEKYSSYIKKKTKKNNVILARDHGGPWQNNLELENNYTDLEAMESAKESFATDIDCGFEIIHIDPSVLPKNKKISQEKIIDKLFELYEFCYQYAQLKKKKILFEVGTEEQSGSTNSQDQIEYNLSKLKKFCLKNKLPFASFVVIQAGTKVMEMKNIGSFEKYFPVKNEIPVEIQLPKMIEICNKYEILMKEHNTDYLSKESLAWHPKLGIHSANVAPEFGVIETKSLINLFKDMKMEKEKEEFLEISLNSKKWEKWMIKGSKASDFEKSIISGHYIFSDERVVELKEKLNYVLKKKRNISLDSLLQNEISIVITKYLKAFRLI